MLYLLSACGGYLIGSIPTAYLLVRRSEGVDIRQTGSGNVGGYNAYVVTRSRLVGLLVIVLDMLKGLAVVLLAGALLGPEFWLRGIGLAAALIGHNYPVWLKFKGGRGLATAAGGLFAIGISYTLLWCVLWAAEFRRSKDILSGNLVAIVLSPILLALLPAGWIDALQLGPVTVSEYRQFAVVLSAVHLVSHRDVVMSLLKPPPKL